MDKRRQAPRRHKFHIKFMVPLVQEMPAQASQPSKTVREAAWKSFFAGLLEFHRLHGHFNVPKHAEHKSLYYWAAHQRVHLEAAGFPGEPGDRRTANKIWDQHFAELLDFHRVNGHFRVTRKNAQPATLLEWVRHQRRAYYSGKLRPERRQRLADIGFFRLAQSMSAFTGTEQSQPVDPLAALGMIWDDRHPEQQWDAKYHDLVAFQKRFGHCYVPHPWPEQPGLGVWVQTQRRQRQAGTLSAEHIARLDEIHFFWTGGWEVLGEDWLQKQKQVMGDFYHEPEMEPEHFSIPRKPPVCRDEDDGESC
jgi:hypothetical protein